MTYLEYFNLFPQQRMGFGQVLLVDALYRHLPVVFLGGKTRTQYVLGADKEIKILCTTVHK